MRIRLIAENSRPLPIAHEADSPRKQSDTQHFFFDQFTLLLIEVCVARREVVLGRDGPSYRSGWRPVRLIRSTSMLRFQLAP
jgi:hypothetical protein